MPWDWDAFAAAQAHYAELGLAAAGEPSHERPTMTQLLRVQNFMRLDRTASAPARARASSGPSATPTPPTWPRGPAPPRAGPTAPSPAAPAGSTTTSPATSPTTSAPRSWAATSSAPSAARGRTTSGRAGGATSPPFHTPVFVLTHHLRPSFTLPTPPSTSSTPRPPRRCGRRRRPPTARTCASAAAWPPSASSSTPTSSTRCTSPSRPIELGRGERLWDSPDELLDRFHLERVPSPSGVTHLLFWRR